MINMAAPFSCNDSDFVSIGFTLGYQIFHTLMDMEDEQFILNN